MLMKRTFKYIIIVWITIIVIDYILKWADIWSNYIIVENILNVVLYLSWIIPILLILLINRKKIKYIFLVIYSLILILLSFPLFFVGTFLFNDLITNNGYSKVYEKELNKREKFVIYITPDKGAFGGSNKMYSLDKKLGFGFVKRKNLDPSEYKLNQGIFTNIDTVYFKKDTMIIDNNKIEK